MSEFGENYSPEGAENFVAPPTGETPTKEEVIESALQQAAQAKPESVLLNPEQLGGDFQNNIDQWTKSVSEAQEVLARDDISEQTRKSWEKDLISSQKNLEHYQQGYEKFKQRHGLS